MLEDLLSELSDRGWLVSNLFQRPDGTWQANLRTATHHTDFGLGLTAFDALAAAMDRIETAELTPIHPILSSVESRKSIADLIAKLQPSEPIRRI